MTTDHNPFAAPHVDCMDCPRCKTLAASNAIYGTLLAVLGILNLSQSAGAFYWLIRAVLRGLGYDIVSDGT